MAAHFIVQSCAVSERSTCSTNLVRVRFRGGIRVRVGGWLPTRPAARPSGLANLAGQSRWPISPISPQRRPGRPQPELLHCAARADAVLCAGQQGVASRPRLPRPRSMAQPSPLPLLSSPVAQPICSPPASPPPPSLSFATASLTASLTATRAATLATTLVTLATLTATLATTLAATLATLAAETGEQCEESMARRSRAKQCGQPAWPGCGTAREYGAARVLPVADVRSARSPLRLAASPG